MYKNYYIYIIISIISAFTLVFIESKRLCGPNHFRCRDGKLCVAAVDVCDQENHCRDRSDENHLLCSGNYTALTRNLRSECKPGMYRCRFGGCIDASKLCNGSPDCYDSSDETTELCRKNRCQGKRFRCGYGGCIPKNKVCDGKRHCLDHSDENKRMCQKEASTAIPIENMTLTNTLEE